MNEITPADWRAIQRLSRINAAFADRVKCASASQYSVLACEAWQRLARIQRAAANGVSEAEQYQNEA